jgi:hypothetical protein
MTKTFDFGSLKEKKKEEVINLPDGSITMDFKKEPNGTITPISANLTEKGLKEIKKAQRKRNPSKSLINQLEILKDLQEIKKLIKPEYNILAPHETINAICDEYGIPHSYNYNQIKNWAKTNLIFEDDLNLLLRLKRDSGSFRLYFDYMMREK